MKINFKKFSHGTTNTNIKQRAHFFSNPYKIWTLFLILAIISVLCLALFSYVLFRRVSTDSIGQEATTEKKPAELINRDKLDAVLKSFDQKQKIFSDTEASLPEIADPSK